MPTVTPIQHASLALQWGDTTIYADPVGDPSLYAALPRPHIIVVTHEHHDHFNPDTLAALLEPQTVLVTNPSVADQLPGGLKKNLIVMKNSDVQTIKGIAVQAIPAYNLRPEALEYHPQGRDNGYVLEAGGTRVYVAGDTEDTPEMRALQDIDIAFVPMNLPYTMTVEAAASGTLAFAPQQVYPYHYRNSDIQKFKQLVEAGDSAIEVILGAWYK